MNECITFRLTHYVPPALPTTIHPLHPLHPTNHPLHPKTQPPTSPTYLTYQVHSELGSAFFVTLILDASLHMVIDAYTDKGNNKGRVRVGLG